MSGFSDAWGVWSGTLPFRVLGCWGFGGFGALGEKKEMDAG